MDVREGAAQQSPRATERCWLASSSAIRSSKPDMRLPPHKSFQASDKVLTTAPILLKQPMGAAAAALATKLFGPGAGPLLEVDTSGACSSECCEEIEVLSSSSSEPHTHASAHESSYNTIPPEQENVCSSGTSVVGRKVYQTSGGKPGTRL